MEGGEVPGDVRAEYVGEPAARGLELVGSVVLAGNEERRHLEPDVRLAPEVRERVEDRLEGSRAHLAVEAVAEGLEVDVGGVHVCEELAARVRTHVARRDGDGADPGLVTGLRRVDGVLEERHRIVVGEGDAAAAERGSRPRDALGGRLVGQRVGLARAADVPVLAVAAREIASGGAKGENGSSREEVVQGLLLDGVDTEAAGAPVAGENDLIPYASANEAQAALALGEPACAGAHIALDPAVFPAVPEARRNRRFCRGAEGLLAVSARHGRWMRPEGPAVNLATRQRDPRIGE